MPIYKKILDVQKKKSALSSKGPTKLKAGNANLPGKILKPETKKNEPVKKIPVKKIIEPKKNVIKPKVVPKDTNLKSPEKLVKTKPDTAPKIVKKNEPKILPATKLEPKMAEQPLISELPEPIYIGRQDLNNLQIARDLEHVIVQAWQPPLGFGANVECTVELKIDALGKVVNFVIKKSSNIAVYDMSVRRIFAQLIMPDSIRNKTLTVVFKQ